MKDLHKLSTEELQAILLTSDGKGKGVKEEALDRLISEARQDSYSEGRADGYNDGYEACREG